jgi:hypothetical protein
MNTKDKTKFIVNSTKHYKGDNFLEDNIKILTEFQNATPHITSLKFKTNYFKNYYTMLFSSSIYLNSINFNSKEVSVVSGPENKQKNNINSIPISMSPPKKYFLQRYYYLFFLVTICYQEDW